MESRIFVHQRHGTLTELKKIIFKKSIFNLTNWKSKVNPNLSLHEMVLGKIIMLRQNCKLPGMYIKTIWSGDWKLPTTSRWLNFIWWRRKELIKERFTLCPNLKNIFLGEELFNNFLKDFNLWDKKALIHRFLELVQH